MEVALNEFAPLKRVILKHPREAFLHPIAIEREWQPLHFTAPPHYARAIDEYDRFAGLLSTAGAEVALLPPDQRTNLDSIYVRDASIAAPGGMILANMGKRLRSGEPAAQQEVFARIGIPVLGAIGGSGRLEGGDLVWLDVDTVAVGEGYRTNAEGIRQLRVLLGEHVSVIPVPLPHWRGASEVLHLMSLLSPVDRDLAVVYSPLMPVPFRQLLLDRGVRLVDTPDEEFETMGTNVLAVAPRRCIMLEGNPRTRAALEQAGAEVMTYEGTEISVKGAGGPTCLTRPVVRGG
jgi:N-dimethylarginine dimethylaminohydrolase